MEASMRRWDRTIPKMSMKRNVLTYTMTQIYDWIHLVRIHAWPIWITTYATHTNALKCEWRTIKWVTGSNRKKRNRKHIDYIIFMQKKFRMKHVCILLFFCLAVWAVFSAPLYYNTILFSPMSRNMSARERVCWARRIKGTMEWKNERVALSSRCEHLLSAWCFSIFFSLLLSISLSSVLLPCIHFTFVICTKHIRFIWRVYATCWASKHWYALAKGRCVCYIQWKTIRTTNGNMVMIIMIITLPLHFPFFTSENRRNKSQIEEKCKR